MVHGPCERVQPAPSCIKNGKCEKYFPNFFRETTEFPTLNAYPQYRRRFNNNIRYNFPGGRYATNQHIVPYNPHLLLIFKCHINVEVVHCIKSIKYLFKYILKGHDVITIQSRQILIENPNDEILRYETLRYIDAMESCWRLFKYPLHINSYTIYRLPIHFDGDQMIYFLPNDRRLEGHDGDIVRETHLTCFFKLNAHDENARQYLYTEIPCHTICIRGRTCTTMETAFN